MGLFAERGFDAVTIAEIAAAAGISPRSFFRYFPTKEDVVLSGLREAGQRVRDELVARPSGEPIWESIRLAFRRLVETPGFSSDDVGLVTLVMTNPAIQSRSVQKRQEWEAILVPEIASRLPRHELADGITDGDRARALLAAALGCVDAATRAWLRSAGKTDPMALFDALMAQIQVA